ncbi:MAG TPA: tetratricopeptide repeat protein, partial [Burkholderiales bacterium]|nr:tetratricopeptide repeat protein [Burkholderiales bacterium]
MAPPGQPAEAVRILDELNRVVRWSNGFTLAFVKCNHPAQRETMRAALLERLLDLRVLEVTLEGSVTSLLEEITARWDPAQPSSVVCVYGLEKSLDGGPEEPRILGRLNHERDLLRRAVPGALLIWLPDFALDRVARGAPDFWAWRSGVYEFTTDAELWRDDGYTILSRDTARLYSLDTTEKRQELERLDELVRTARSLPKQDAESRRTVAQLSLRKGVLLESRGDLDEALQCFQDSLEVSKTIRDERLLALIQRHISDILQARGKLDQALRVLKEEVLPAFERFGEVYSKAVTQGKIAGILEARGEL